MITRFSRLIASFLSFFTVVLLLSGAAVLPSSAQEPDRFPQSVGVEAPEDVTAIEAYLLPDWRYSTLTFDGSGETGGGTRTRQWPDSTFTGQNTATGLQLTSAYRAFWERESRVARLRVRPTLKADWRRAESDKDRSDGRSESRENRRSRLRGVLQVGGFWDRYIEKDVFIRLQGSGLAEGLRRATEQKRHVNGSLDDQSERTSWFGRHRVRIRTGFGIGRIRDVTPVVRALRVRERLNAIGVDASLSAKEVQQAAHQFARRPGYEAVYDRPDKAFWRDFFRRTMGSGTDLSPFDAFYVADVFRERLGRRREGARLVIGPQLGHQSKERVQIGAFIRGEWSENLSLRHQLQAEAEAEYNSVGLGATIGRGGLSPRSSGRQLAAVGERESGWRGAGLVSWQWNVADRTLVRNGIRAQFRAFESQDASRSRVQLFSVVRIFAEDQFVITGEGSLAYRAGSDEVERRPETEAWDWNLGVSVNYLLSRTLR